MDERLPKGWFSPHDVGEYRRIYEELVPARGQTAEVGCYLGRSICSVADIIRRKKITVDCVDLWQPWANDISEDQALQFLKNVAAHELIQGLHLWVWQRSSTERIIYTHPTYDFVFIDADHEYESVMNDINAWWPRVKRGGWIGGHDYPSFPGVVKAVTEKFPDAQTGMMSEIWLYQKPLTNS